MKPLRISREIQDYILSLNGLLNNEISELTNEKYGKYVDKGTIKRVFDRNGVERIYKKLIAPNRFYSEEMLTWLKEHYEITKDKKQLTRDFNEKFGTNKEWHHLSHIIGREHWQTKAFNKQEKEKHHFYMPIGSEKVKAGMIYVKVNNITDKEKGDIWSAWKLNWQPKNRYMYEKYHNVKLSDDEVITFLNGDTTDFSEENLLKVSRFEFTQLNMMKANGKGELTLTALEIIRCKQIINKVAKDSD